MDATAMIPGSLLLLATLLTAAHPAPTCDLGCERAAATALLTQGDAGGARDRLRAARERFPEATVLDLLIARSYLLENNLFWAERTLVDALARHPGDERLTAWLAAVHLRQGDPDLAAEDLARAPLPKAGPEQARLHLLEAFRAYLAGEDEAVQQALDQVPRNLRVHPEDRPVWHFLQGLDPLYQEGLNLSLELAAGRTSNALAGAPTDPSGAGSASPLADLKMRARLAPPSSAGWGAVADFELNGHWLADSDFRELSSLEGATRLAGSLRRDDFRLTLGYRAELLALDQDHATYSEAHRGELELETRAGLLLFAGGGRRAYRDDRRTRWEGDAGIGAPLSLWPGVHLLAGATLRWADATSPAYDQRGVSLAVSAQVGLGRGFGLRLSGAGSWDDYPHSGGSEGRLVFGSSEPRRDLLGRLIVRLLAPTWHGLQPALEWQLSHRDSTVDEPVTGSYDFTESRIAVVVRWKLDGDPWAPAAVEDPLHVPLEWGLGGAGGPQTQRIIDLLRQDEELRRGSSCQVR